MFLKELLRAYDFKNCSLLLFFEGLLGMSLHNFFERGFESFKDSLVSYGCPDQYANLITLNLKNDFYSNLIDNPNAYFQCHFFFNLNK